MIKIHKYDVFFPLKRNGIEFEGLSLDTINNQDILLRTIYGNYWRFPSKVSPPHDNEI